MSDITPPRPVRRKVTEQPAPPVNVVEGPVTPQPEVDVVVIPEDTSAEMFKAGWFAALEEVELQWSHGSDGLTRFLATQKRDR